MVLGGSVPEMRKRCSSFSVNQDRIAGCMKQLKSPQRVGYFLFDKIKKSLTGIGLQFEDFSVSFSLSDISETEHRFLAHQFGFAAKNLKLGPRPGASNGSLVTDPPDDVTLGTISRGPRNSEL
jgi:hypothetical protein